MRRTSALTIDRLPANNVSWSPAEPVATSSYTDASTVALTTSIALTEFIQDHVAQLLGFERVVPPWAHFVPPGSYMSKKTSLSRFFTHQTMESIDPTNVLERLETMIEELTERSQLFSIDVAEHIFDFLKLLETLDGLIKNIKNQILRHRKG